MRKGGEKMKKFILFVFSIILLGSLSVSPVLADLSFEQGLTDWTTEYRDDSWATTTNTHTHDIVSTRYSDGIQSVRLGAKVAGDSSVWSNDDHTVTMIWKNGTYDLTHGLSVSVDMADIQHATSHYGWGWGMDAYLVLSDGANETFSLLWDYHQEPYGPVGSEDNMYTEIVTGADGYQWFRYNRALTADKWGAGSDFYDIGGALTDLDLSNVKIGVVYAAVSWHSSPQSLWANGLVDNVQIEYEPITAPAITGFINPTLTCGAITNLHSTTVDWTDSTGGAGGITYEYNVDYPLVGGGRGQWTTFLTPSQRTGTLNEGIHYIKIKAKDAENNYSDWSNICEITADWTAPDVEITNPGDGSTVSGTVDIRGSVEDVNPHHYWFVIQNSEGTTVAGPGVVNETNSFTDISLLNWDTALVPDGEYVIKLEARDAADNKDNSSSDWHTVIVNNTPDNKDQCKNDGWRAFYSPTFKNQGDCVSFVQSNPNAIGNKSK